MIVAAKPAIPGMSENHTSVPPVSFPFQAKGQVAAATTNRRALAAAARRAHTGRFSSPAIPITTGGPNTRVGPRTDHHAAVSPACATINGARIAR